MNAASRTLGDDPWLGHAQALRRLAASLVRDEGEALDLLQETWVRSGAETRSLAWLRTVLRNLARDRVRERARRRWSEQNAARDERLPSSAEIVEGLELAQCLAREVAALDEPLRLVVHLRYFEGLAPEEIAARGQLPLETVRTRLKRGLARLRERLDRAHGGERRAWAAALLPLARGTLLESTIASAGLVTTVTTLAMSTKILSSAAVVVLVGLGMLLLREEVAPSLAPAAPAVPDVVLASAPEYASEPEASTREPAPAAPAPVAETAAVAAATDSVEITIVLVDEEGREHRDESGTLTLAAGTPTDFAKQDLAFTAGRCRVALLPGDWIVFGMLVAGGRAAVLPEPSPIVPAGEPLVVRAQWLRRGRLRVLDALTRRELTGIEVRCADGWRANPEWTHPGDHPSVQTVLREAASPLELPDRTRLTIYWVHAPGHAWASLQFDHRAGGERSIELSPLPSTVSVVARGELPPGAYVRLYALDPAPEPGPNGILILRPPPAELPSWLASVSLRADPSGTTQITDFQGGRYLASVEVGEYEERLRLGSAEVDVPAGGAAMVIVPVDAAQLDVPRTHLHGTIRVPEGLARESCALRLKRLEGGEKEFQQLLIRMSYRRGEPDLLRWDAGPMRAGTYLASFDAIQYRETFETRAAGTETVVDFVLPPLGSVRVEVVDRVTGEPLDAKVSWTGVRPPGVNEFTLSKAMRDPLTRELGFVAARGPIEVSARHEGYRDASQSLELTGPTTTCRLELEPATGVRVVMREGEATLPVDFDYFHRIVVTDADGALIPIGRWITGATALVPLDPGRYVLSFPALDGFEPLEPRAVEVRAGKVFELVLSAVRKP